MHRDHKLLVIYPCLIKPPQQRPPPLSGQISDALRQ